MAKVGNKSAYRHIPIHPNSQWVTGFKKTFEDGTTRFLQDSKLPFGAGAPPSIFHCISQVVKRVVQRRHENRIMTYQEDFLIIDKSYEDRLNARVIHHTAVRSRIWSKSPKAGGTCDQLEDPWETAGYGEVVCWNNQSEVEQRARDGYRRCAETAWWLNAKIAAPYSYRVDVIDPIWQSVQINVLGWT